MNMGIMFSGINSYLEANIDSSVTKFLAYGGGEILDELARIQVEKKGSKT